MAGQYGYNGSAAAEQSFSRGNEYMVQAAGMQAQGLTNSAQIAAQSVREFHRMLQERDEFQLRAQQADMEMQLNRQKLADMQAVDAATMSRKQIELMTAQIDAAKQEMQIRGEDFEYSKSIRGYTTDQKMIAAQQAKAELDKTLISNGTHYRDDSGELQPVKTASDKAINAKQREEFMDPLIKAKISGEQNSIEYTKAKTEYMKKKQEIEQLSSVAKTEQDKLRLEIMKKDLELKGQQAKDLLQKVDPTSMPAAVRNQLFQSGDLVFDPATGNLRPINESNPEEVQAREEKRQQAQGQTITVSQVSEHLKYYEGRIEQARRKSNDLTLNESDREKSAEELQKLEEQRDNISKKIDSMIQGKPMPESRVEDTQTAKPVYTEPIGPEAEPLAPETIEIFNIFKAKLPGGDK
jgi:hypothetical protein